MQITFRADAEQFDAIRADIVPDNLEIFTIYYPDNETADEPDEQLTGVLQTKVNRKNEKSPAKFTRPKMGITKQAGEKSHRQPG